jgi:hypothetical protein
MSSPKNTPYRVALPTLLGGAGGFLNALLLWLQVPEKVAEFKPIILLCGALHGAVLAACGVAAANLALRHARLRPAIWLAAGYVAGWLSWVPAHFFLAKNPLLNALFWPFTLDHPWEAAWRPFQYFGLVGLLLAVALTLAPTGARRSALGMRGLCMVSGVLGSLWFWGVFQTPMRLGYFALIHGAIWGLLVGAGLAWRRKLENP